MGAMPLPKFQTLYLHPDASRVRLESVSPSICEFGRFHFTAAEIKEIERIERFKNKMAFQILDLSVQPKSQVGRNVTDPKVSITEGGRYMFNSVIQKRWNTEEITKALVYWDVEKRMLGFKGFKANEELPKGAKAFCELKKGNDKSLSASGAWMLKTYVKYDFESAKNQSFEAKYNDANKIYVIVIPSETPKPIERAPRKKADKVVAMTAVNGAIAATQAPPAEEELLIQD